MQSLDIPCEISSLICAEVEERCNLATLCRTSRVFREEAQRILYHTIDLEGRGMRSVWSWAHAVIRNPHVAKRVHALSLQLSEDQLRISCNEADRSECIQGWILQDAPFRLTKFANSYFNCSSLGDFWNTQSDIRVLSFPRSYDTFSQGQLPTLIAFGAISWYALPDGRPLQRLETGLARDFSPLAQYSQTLTTLNLVRKSVDHDVTLYGTIKSILALFPALLHFGIAELVKQPETRLVELCPAARLGKFPKLETFFLLLRNFDRIHRRNHFYHMDSGQDVADLACSIMHACPKLRRVVVGAEVQVELTCTVTRDIDGNVHTSLGTKINFGAVSMFWKPS
ncbi:hypothetical protein B0H12DRAFT_1233987 [Mycena haematopus]|nr:hypothetical protein B0H12DRAFT_1233987 [Mycena haematopus]